MFEIGGSLREARTRQGLELHDAERATRIRAKYLGALEDERFDQLPEEVYAKAFLRTYADFLGLDSELYVAELNSRFEATRPPPPPEPERRVTLPRLGLRSAAALGGGAAFVAVGLLAWRFGAGVEERAPPASPARPPAVTTTTSTTGAKPRPGRNPAVARFVLVAARGDCWLSVRAGSRDGRVLYEGMLREGKSVGFASKRLWIRMGAPWNLEARLNGRAVRGLPADTGNVVVTRAGVRLAR